MKSGRKFLLCEVMQEPRHSFHHLHDLWGSGAYEPEMPCSEMADGKGEGGGREQHCAL